MEETFSNFEEQIDSFINAYKTQLENIQNNKKKISSGGLESIRKDSSLFSESNAAIKQTLKDRLAKPSEISPTHQEGLDISMRIPSSYTTRNSREYNKTISPLFYETPQNDSKRSAGLILRNPNNISRNTEILEIDEAENRQSKNQKHAIENKNSAFVETESKKDDVKEQEHNTKLSKISEKKEELKKKIHSSREQMNKDKEKYVYDKKEQEIEYMRLKRLAHENEKLTTQLSEMNQRKEEMIQTKAFNDILKEENKKKEKEINELLRQNDILKMKVDNINNLLIDLVDLKAKMSGLKEYYEKQLKDSANEINDLVKEIKTLKRERTKNQKNIENFLWFLTKYTNHCSKTDCKTVEEALIEVDKLFDSLIRKSAKSERSLEKMRREVESSPKHKKIRNDYNLPLNKSKKEEEKSVEEPSERVHFYNKETSLDNERKRTEFGKRSISHSQLPMQNRIKSIEKEIEKSFYNLTTLDAKKDHTHSRNSSFDRTESIPINTLNLTLEEVGSSKIETQRTLDSIQKIKTEVQQGLGDFSFQAVEDIPQSSKEKKNDIDEKLKKSIKDDLDSLSKLKSKLNSLQSQITDLNQDDKEKQIISSLNNYHKHLKEEV